jgi:streptogrisin C
MKHVVLVRSTAALLLASAMVVPVVTGSTGRPGVGLSPLGQVRESVAYLVGTYHVSTADALRRVRLDAESAALGRRLAAALPDEYAGMWLDQRHGGVLVVAATRLDRARSVVRRLPQRGEIRLRTATYSLRDLARIRDTAQARTGAGGYAQINPVRDRVEVWTAHPARTLAALGSATRAVAVQALPPSTPTACRPAACDPPIRAGITIQMADADGRGLQFCSSAFNIQDDTGALYTSTAGHCFTQLPGAATITSASTDQIIADRYGPNAATEYTVTPRLDYAIVPIRYPTVWLPAGKPRNIDYFKCGDPSPSMCFTSLNKHRYRIWDIQNYGAMTIGNLVCMSGASADLRFVKPGTRCGEITGLPAGGIETNICAKRGDSGSPLFNQVTHTAFGIESSATNVDSPCGPAADQHTFYTALSSALASAHQITGRTYTVITGP